jgi:hypothetical protein
VMLSIPQPLSSTQTQTFSSDQSSGSVTSNTSPGPVAFPARAAQVETEIRSSPWSKSLIAWTAFVHRLRMTWCNCDGSTYTSGVPGSTPWFVGESPRRICGTRSLGALVNASPPGDCRIAARAQERPSFRPWGILGEAHHDSGLVGLS